MNCPRFIIDNLGNITINKECIIHQDLLFNDIKNFSLNYDIYNTSHHYLWVYFDKITIDDYYFYINLCFYNKKIWGADICFFHKNESKTSWESWQDTTGKHKKHYELWLNQMFEDKRCFDWGKISTYDDPKTKRSGIWLSYQNQIPN